MLADAKALIETLDWEWPFFVAQRNLEPPCTRESSVESTEDRRNRDPDLHGHRHRVRVAARISTAHWRAGPPEDAPRLDLGHHHLRPGRNRARPGRIPHQD